MRSIVFASGKGGVGRTSIALNLGIMLSSAGKKVVVVDADISMANISLLLGVERTPISIQNVLMGEANIEDAIYEGPNGLRYIPAELSLERVKSVDYEKLADVVKTLDEYDFVLLDSPPGLGRDAEAAMKAAGEAVLVLTPEPGALADALKVKNFADKKGVKVLGFAVNMVLRDKAEIRKQDLETILGAKALVEIPVDLEVRRSSAMQIPVVVRAPHSPFSRAMRVLAAKLTGEAIEVQVKVKKGFFSRLLEWLFGRKKKEEAKEAK
jgi:septum site-determining protein MinD